MDGWNADIGGTWVAHIHGASTKAYPIGFESVDARERANNAEIMVAFREWDVLYDETYRKPAENEDHMNRLCEAMWAIEKRVRTLPATTPRALLAKFVMASTYGTFMLGDDADALFVEARAVLS